ncbi:hypothetical protein XACJJ10_1700016 [Xanthomonas citri pv. citri]|nr:hypothetical protein XACLG98_2390015 [Xanthomonas citri pv. citri]CEI35836.1 hypothetical protein XACJJ10_1700016 [Xanthomonas citri pv. citri]
MQQCDQANTFSACGEQSTGRQRIRAVARPAAAGKSLERVMHVEMRCVGRQLCGAGAAWRRLGWAGLGWAGLAPR